MTRRPPTALELALLGLVLERPRSGYALRKVFETTPIGRFSSSPGAIYPALARLEADGLLRGEADRTHPRRPARVFRLTRAGRRATVRALRAPLSRDDAARRPDEVLLRYAFLPLVADNDEIARFLSAYRSAMDAEVHVLRAFADGDGAAYPQHARLALRHGIALYEARAAWAAAALATILQTPRETAR